MNTIGGVPGWRLVFGCIAAISCLTAILIDRFMEDPPREVPLPTEATKPSSALSAAVRHCKGELSRARALTRIPTFNVIAVQGSQGLAVFCY
jgi:hypothetical protein